MNYKHSCVVDAENNYKTLVLVLLEQDEDGQPKESIQYYELLEGESLIDTTSPSMRPHAGAVGLISPKWSEDTSTWEEAATEAEIAAWEAEHPAPEPVTAPPTTEELADENKLLRAQLEATSDRQEFLEDCMAEMAGQVYNV